MHTYIHAEREEWIGEEGKQKRRKGEKRGENEISLGRIRVKKFRATENMFPQPLTEFLHKGKPWFLGSHSLCFHHILPLQPEVVMASSSSVHRHNSASSWLQDVYSTEAILSRLFFQYHSFVRHDFPVDGSKMSYFF